MLLRYGTTARICALMRSGAMEACSCGTCIGTTTSIFFEGWNMAMFPNRREQQHDTGRRSSPRTLDMLPHDPAPDATLSLLSLGYRFIPQRCARLKTDAFRTRLMLRDVICMQDPDAAALLYGTPGLTRRGAMPKTVLHLLQDEGSVQQIEGEPHQHRKSMFLGLLTEQGRADALAEAFRMAWMERLATWEGAAQVTLLTEASTVIAHAVTRWCGLPFSDDEVEEIAGTLFSMIDATGKVSPAVVKALADRSALEERLRAVVRDARAQPEDDTPLHVIARHRDLAGDLLTEEVAAVEILNLLRPTVAVGRYIVFAALTLHRLPEWRDHFATGQDTDLEEFVEEVRRISPFFPFTAAVTTQEVRWRDMILPEGQWLMLDLYGTCQDPVAFPIPAQFRPGRGLSWRNQDYHFIPQGAGRIATTHRCPGELVTVRLMAEAVRMLCCDMRYQVPEQDLSVSLKQIPAQPADGFVIAQVRRQDV